MPLRFFCAQRATGDAGGPSGQSAPSMHFFQRGFLNTMSPRSKNQDSPLIMPVSVSMSIPMYPGTEGRPGMVVISPVSG